MSNVHPKLIEVVINQTPRAMAAMLVVSFAYLFIFIPFIPLIFIFTWLLFQIILAAYRLQNVKMFKKHLQNKDTIKINKAEVYFIVLNVFQAAMWAIASLLVLAYAPQPFEFVMFLVSVGVITAATLSMSSLYKAYLIFIFSLITPQILIMLYYGDEQHIALVIFIMIYIPAIILLSKTMLNNRISSIEAHEALEKSTEKFRQLSITDALTNIYNRRYFFEIAKNIILIASREQKCTALLMLDVDYFKRINDTFGHQAGDFVLIELVKSIKDTMRSSDLFARVGGEEFAILLNNTSLTKAKVIAEKIRSMIENKEFIYNTVSIKTTISIGISEVNEGNFLLENVYKNADTQLYKAKENGRNRVCP